MAQKYLYAEIDSCQKSKYSSGPCGDAFLVHRSSESTIIVLCDGIGSGIKAYIAAKMCISRAIGLIKEDFTFRQTFQSLVDTMNQWRSPDKPFVAFSMVKIANDGKTTILTYDIPDVILLSGSNAVVLESKPVLIDQAVAREARCCLRPGDSLVLFTDGISQAGIGNGNPNGFECGLIASFIGDSVRKGAIDIPNILCKKAIELSSMSNKDDMTVISANCRYGQILNIFSGPPLCRSKDSKVVKQFLDNLGQRVVCGATTAKIVSQQTGKKLEVQQNSSSMIAPPRYFIKGIDLVTEGAVTLNHLYNILDMPLDRLEENSGVTELYKMIKHSDWINFIIGRSQNPANDDITFYQQGIIYREKIIKLIGQKLENDGKLISYNYV
jgi:hypothetical protein